MKSAPLAPTPMPPSMQASSPTSIIMIAMAISGGLAGLVAVNEVLGAQHRLLLEYVQGAGFVGIAVALMGRTHPVGIVLVGACCLACSIKAALNFPSPSRKSTAT